MSRLSSLTTRLVLTAVALVVLVSVLIGAAATAALYSSLTGRLDREVLSSLQRAGDGDRDSGRDGDGPGGPRPDARNQQPGTLIAFLGSGDGGCVLTEAVGGCRALPDDALAVLAEVPADRKVHGVDLPGVGSYRVTAVQPDGDGDTVVTGLPTDDLEDTIASLLAWEALLILLGALAAAGAGLVVVRRQLRPLREVAATAHAVAELPLSSGAIDLDDRVPAHLTDERTEVGQVGAALNALLAHVGASLDARHRSELQVRQFVADASHELRSPLATIVGYTELARTRPDESTVRTALAKVEEESGRMTSLVEDLLLLARLDAGRPLEHRPVDLTRLLLEAVSDARVLAPDHHWRLELPEEAVEVGGRRAGTAPGGHEPADQCPQVHPARHHGHRERRRVGTLGPRRRTGIPARGGPPGVRAVRPRRLVAHPLRLRRRGRARPGPGPGDRDGPRWPRHTGECTRRHPDHGAPGRARAGGLSSRVRGRAG